MKEYLKAFSANILVFLLFTSWIWSGCNPTKKLKEGQYLLTKNTVKDVSESLFQLNKTIDESELEGYIRQKPNRKVLGVRFHLWLYNLVDEEKMKRSKQKRDERFDRINQKRIEENKIKNEQRVAKGKKPRDPKLKNKDRLVPREWLMNIGEAPVIFDTLLLFKSVVQIHLYLINKGYFNSEVYDSVRYTKKKAKAYYYLNPKKPYTIKQINYWVEDPELRPYVLSDTNNSIIKRGNNFDVDAFQKERDRITEYLHNEGYYYFSKEQIRNEADSSLNSNEVNITFKIFNPVKQASDQSDSLVPLPNKKFYIRNVYVLTNYNAKATVQRAKDTIQFKDVTFVYNRQLRYKPSVLVNDIYISKNNLYQNKNTDHTYKRLAELRSFKFINIVYKDVGNNNLDCFIQLSPVIKQTFTVETEYTNTGGNGGVAANFVYQNKNPFKGAEVLEFKLKGGLSVQSQSYDNTNTEKPKVIDYFNAKEIGPELNLYVPRFLLPFKIKVSQNANPKTIFTTAYNYQLLQIYTRSAGNLSFGYTWKESPAKTHSIYPAEVNIVRIVLKDKFKEYLETLNDPIVTYRYSNHFTTDTRYSFVYNTQDFSKLNSFTLLRINVESSGTFLRGIYRYLDSKGKVTPAADGSYTIQGLTFSQYIRSDIDFRRYFILSRHNKIAFRLAFGVGKPLYNLRELPLEKSFFGGGPTSIRAWRMRTLGPGTFSDPENKSNSFDKIGDNQIESNLEYRFNITKVLNAAFFVDAGNIWLRKYDVKRPGGEFKFTTRIIDEFAIGAGVGIRLDFNFFIIRFDLALPLKDPAYPEGDRWQFRKAGMLKRINPNFGIGYPF